MKKKVLWVILTCLMVVALVLASCAPAAKPTTSTAPTTPVAPTVPTTPTTPTIPLLEPTKPITAEKPKYGGAINLVTPVFQIFDIYRYESFSLYVASLYLEKLAMGDWAVDRKIWSWLNMQGYSPLEYMKGQLLESWEAPDPLTIILHVRKGVHFQDKSPVNGREFTADDVVWNIERVKKSPFLDQKYLADIESITKLDKYTAQIKLKIATVSSLVGILSQKATFCIARESVGQGTEITDWRLAIGTGAFMIEDYVADSALTFKRNPNYWGFDELHTENRLPYADSIKVLIIADPSTQYAALRTGKVDQSGTSAEIQYVDADSLLKSAPHMLSRGIPASNPRFFRLAVTKKPYDDVRVRQALSMAIDRNEIIKSVFGGHASYYSGMLHPAHGELFTPYENLPDKPMWTTVSVKEVLSYNPKRAKELLAQAGYPNGFKTQIDTSPGKDPPGITEVLPFYLAKIGVQAEIKVYDVPAYDAMRFGHKFEQIMLYWGTFNPDSLNLLRNFTDPKMQYNLGEVDDPVFTAKWNEASVTFDDAKRNEMVHWLDMYDVEHAWDILFPHYETVIVWQPWLKGYSGEGNLGYYNMGALFARLWVDQKLKKSLGF